MQAKPKGPTKSHSENCQAREQEKATNSNPIARWKMADSDGDKAYIVSQVRLFPYNIYSWTGEGGYVLGLLNI